MSVSVDRLAVRWRADADPADADRRRFDSLLRQLRDDVLEDALADAAGSRGAEVCVRRVSTGLRMRWNLPDAELVAGWARALAAAVHAAAAEDIVRYPSRAHARRDVLGSVLAGRRERAWAWEMLRLWPPGAPADGTADAEAVRLVLADAFESAPIVPAASLVVVAAEAGRLDRLVELLGPAALTECAALAWAAAGGSPLSWPSDMDDRQAASLPAFGEQITTAVVRHSVIHRSATQIPGTRGSDRSVAASLAALAVLEVEPASARSAAGAVVVEALAARQTSGLSRVPHARAEATAPRAGVKPTLAAVTHPVTDDALADPVTDDAAAHPVTGAAAALAAFAVPAAPAMPAPDAVWRTGWGGLLFVLSLVADAGLPERVLADPAGYGPALRPVLHALAHRLVTRAVPDADPADPADPALMAFCGLAPDDEPPEPGPATHIGAEADAIVAELRARLGAEPATDERALLATTFRRCARVEADPGWIDIVLDIDEATIEVRRAGLDLDPGHLPWLGCVLRFRYE